MDGGRFDSLTRQLGQGGSRRALLKGLLGFGGTAIAASRLVPDASAARRPTPTPKPVTCPGQQHWDGSACVCPQGSDTCGPDCCPTGQAECCDNACCYGVCYGEELCCPYGSLLCDGACIAGADCCSTADCAGLDDPVNCVAGVCQDFVCGTVAACDADRCCAGYGCLGDGQCCTVDDCGEPDDCESVACSGDHECVRSFDCRNDEGAGCCAEGETCDADGACVCTPVCEGLVCGSPDGCGGMCPCPNGGVCVNGGCFTACDPGNPTPCNPCANCVCREAAGGGAYCLNTATSVGPCEIDSDCPSGALCSTFVANFSFLCTIPCCAA